MCMWNNNYHPTHITNLYIKVLNNIVTKDDGEMSLWKNMTQEICAQKCSMIDIWFTKNLNVKTIWLAIFILIVLRPTKKLLLVIGNSTLLYKKQMHDPWIKFMSTRASVR